jgi:hypothetical protein
MPNFLRDLVQERHHRAEHAARGDHVVACLQQAEHHRGDGRHAGGGGHACLGALERGQAVWNMRTVGLVKRE